MILTWQLLQVEQVQEESRGRIKYKIEYDFTTQELKVTVSNFKLTQYFDKHTITLTYKINFHKNNKMNALSYNFFQSNQQNSTEILYQTEKHLVIRPDSMRPVLNKSIWHHDFTITFRLQLFVTVSTVYGTDYCICLIFLFLFFVLLIKPLCLLAVIQAFFLAVWAAM